MVAFLVYLLVLVLISLANFWLYASDKMRAKNNLWRIPEKLLLAVGFFGGALGGLCGMSIFRHKTKHWQFKVLVPVFLAVHIALAVWLVKSGLIS